ncbi:MAG: class I SAM-dependent methyltransferase [Clostridia bacterium]|nr:class I SAM-dependent methyltransferase [Clostridia bacterium]
MNEPILKSARYIAAEYMERVVRPGDIVVDATMGNGHDTLKLAELVGPTGRVYAFDVQEQALQNTEKLLNERGVLDRVRLIRDSHAEMAGYLKAQPRLIVFNLGWLPGGDKSVTTLLSSTNRAVDEALDLLMPEGWLIVCCYPGHNEGKRELAMLAEKLTALPPQRFNCLLHVFLNAGEDAPRCFVVQKQAKGNSN